MASTAGERDRARNLRVWLRFEHSVALSTKQAAALLASLGADATEAEVEVETTGRDLLTGLPRTLVLKSADLRAAAEVPPLPW